MFAADKTTRNKSLSLQLSQIVNCRAHCSRDNCQWLIHFRRLSTIVLKDTVIHKKVIYTAVVLCNTIQNTLIINIMVSCSKSFKLNLCAYMQICKRPWILVSVLTRMALFGPCSSQLAALFSEAPGSLLSHPAIMVEYYQILGVRKDASAEDIKKAWVDQILLWLFLFSQQTQFVIITESCLYSTLQSIMFSVQ